MLALATGLAAIAATFILLDREVRRGRIERDSGAVVLAMFGLSMHVTTEAASDRFGFVPSIGIMLLVVLAMAAWTLPRRRPPRASLSWTWRWCGIFFGILVPGTLIVDRLI